MVADKEFQAYLFKAANGDYLLACWNIRLNQPARILTIDSITGSFNLVDLFGNETPVPVAQNVAFIEAGRHPVTLRISGQSQEPRLAPAITSLPSDIVLTPGVESSFAIACRNPLNRALNLSLSLATPAGLAVAPASAELTLPAEASQQLPFVLKALPDFQASPREQPLLNVSIAVGSNVTRSISAPIRPVRKMAGIGGTPDFILDSAAQVNSCVINEPGTTHLFWTG
ncbi:MAG: hypothetical protein GX617_09280 [Lentisphaerae bacterium]|nr:hypothetical protein [Lentisphaerota bacterium]